MADEAKNQCEAPLLELLGIHPCFQPERDEIPVDLDKLRRFHRGEVTENVFEEILDTIAMYRNWYIAYARIVDEAIKRHQP